MEVSTSTRIFAIVSFIIYAVVCVVLGNVVSRKAKKGEGFGKSYFAGGGNMNFLAAGFMIAASFASGGTFLSNPGLAHAWGLMWPVCIATFTFSGLIAASIINKKLKIVCNRINAVSLGAVLQNRYGNNKFIAWYTPISIILFTGLFLYQQMTSGARLMETMTGLPYVWGLVIFGVILLAYTVVGGSKGTAAVSIFQGFVMTVTTVVLAIGITPDTALAKEAGLELGIKGSIVVNDRMETSVPDIYAAGDAVQVKHYVTGEDTLISLAGPANKQGRIIADNICGGDSRYLGSQGSSVIKVFDITAATTGINETNAKKAGLDVDKVILSPMSHAGYYPGGKLMTMKVVFEKGTCRLLGAQIVGYEGVDKRIDVLAAAIHAGMRATQLKNLDLAYAPPYSSAKDPVNIAGFMIDNIANGTMKQWYLEDVDHLPRDGSAILLDVRTPDEYAGGHMEGFGNIPLDDLRDRLDEIEPGKPVYVSCQSGLRSYIACRILEANGHEAYNFAGGFRFYDAVTNDRALVERAMSCGMDK